MLKLIRFNCNFNKFTLNFAKRNYHKHMELARKYNDEEKKLAIKYRFFHRKQLTDKINKQIEDLGKKCLIHNRAGNLLKKIDENLQIKSEDFDTHVLRIIDKHRKQNFSSKEIYKKYDQLFLNFKENNTN